MPWWAEQTGGDEYFIELSDSVVCGVSVEDESRGWGCWVEMYCAYGMPDEIALVTGPLPNRSPTNPDDFSGRKTYVSRVRRGPFELRLITKIYKDVVATVHVEFPPKA